MWLYLETALSQKLSILMSSFRNILTPADSWALEKKRWQTGVMWGGVIRYRGSRWYHLSAETTKPATPPSWTCRLQSCETKSFYWSSHLGFGIFVVTVPENYYINFHVFCFLRIGFLLVWRYRPVILALGKMRQQVDWEFEVNLNYILRTSLTKRRKKKNRKKNWL
jgi:hypothetical protein